MADMMTRQDRSVRRGGTRRLGWLTLVVLAFAAGVAVAQVEWMPGSPAASVRAPQQQAALGQAGSGQEAASALSAGEVRTATPVPPTPVPQATATPTSREDGALPTLYIDIPPDAFARLEAKRDEALASWILMSSDEDFVPATVRLGRERPIEVELRLKGDWGDHFVHDKWSYRVETEGDAALLGMHVFSLQDPSTRTYLNEWLFLENVRDEGVLGVSYRFVQGVQNGTAMGVYALEESFGKELVESQARREGVIVRYNENLLWEYWAAYEHDEVAPRGVQEVFLIDEFDSGRVARNPALAAQREIAIGKLRGWWRGELAAPEVFDVEKLGRFWALVDLWGAHHAVRWHNLRFYYNPVTTMLEPIAFDTQPLGEGAEVAVETLPGLAQVVEHGDGPLFRAYVRALWRISQPAYLDALRAGYEAEFTALQAALRDEFAGAVLDDGTPALEPPWERLAARQAALRELLSPVQTTYAYLPMEAPTGTLTLDVGNILDLPVEIVGVRHGETSIPAELDWVADPGAAPAGEQLLPSAAGDGALVLQPLARDAAFIPYVRLEVPAEDLGEVSSGDLLQRDLPLTLETRVWGLTTTLTQPVALTYPPPGDGPLPEAPSLDAFLAAHPMARAASETSRSATETSPGADAVRMIEIPAGTWPVTRSMVLPEGYGLQLAAGATLRFAPDAYLMARGPLIFNGTPDAPVVLGPLRGTPNSTTWPGIIVLDAGAPSYWNDVVIEQTEGFYVPGWSLTGGVTFHESPVRFERVRFLGTAAEDALNVIRADLLIVDSEFADTASDAIDVDFGQGEIVRTAFRDIAADGVDISGSEIHLQDVHLMRLGDKGVSVGEASRLSAENLIVRDAAFGIASKDLSQVTAQTVTIERVTVAALAAYIKKPAYGPATIVAKDVTLVDVPPDRTTLVQTGSWIELNGTRVWGTEVDVDALYGQ